MEETFRCFLYFFPQSLRNMRFADSQQPFAIKIEKGRTAIFTMAMASRNGNSHPCLSFSRHLQSSILQYPSEQTSSPPIIFIIHSKGNVKTYMSCIFQVNPFLYTIVLKKIAYLEIFHLYCPKINRRNQTCGSWQPHLKLISIIMVSSFQFFIFIFDMECNLVGLDEVLKLKMK